jgi:hypothetical protein
MVPKKGFSAAFYRMAGESVFLDTVQRTLLRHLNKVRNGRTHTFLSNNGQTAQGISQNAGAERYYTWENTLIDCREIPAVLRDGMLDGFSGKIEKLPGFLAFKTAVEERSGGFLKASLSVKILQGQQNKRYNIRLEPKSKYEEFDIVRVGVCLTAQTPEDFKMGLFHLLNWEKQHHPDYEGCLFIPQKAPA